MSSPRDYLSAGRERWTTPTGLVAHNAAVRAMTLLPGGLVLTGGEDGLATVFDVASGAKRVEMRLDPPAEIRAVAATADSSRYLTGARDGHVRVYDEAGALVADIAAHADAISAIARVGDIQFITAGHDKTLRRVDLSTEPPSCAELMPTADIVTALLTLPDGRVLAGGFERRLSIIDVAGGALAVTYPAPFRVTSFAQLEGGNVLVGTGDKEAVEVNAATGEVVQRFKGASAAVTSVAALPGGFIAAASEDANVRIYKRASAEQVSELRGCVMVALRVRLPLDDGVCVRLVLCVRDVETVAVPDMLRELLCVPVIDPVRVGPEGLADGVKDTVCVADVDRVRETLGE